MGSSRDTLTICPRYSRLAYGNCHNSSNLLDRGERFIWQGRGHALPEHIPRNSRELAAEQNNAFEKEYTALGREIRGLTGGWKGVQNMLNTMGEE